MYMYVCMFLRMDPVCFTPFTYLLAVEKLEDRHEAKDKEFKELHERNREVGLFIF